jgi:hypothetical protein
MLDGDDEKLRRRYEVYDLDGEYRFAAERLGAFQLAIVGKDPFPTDPCNIPFVKQEWHLLDRRSAGYYLSRSAFGPEVNRKFESPRVAAFALLKRGVVLLNASYRFLEKERASREKHFAFVLESLDVNFPLLEKAGFILLCGDAGEMMSWVVDIDPMSFEAVPHPSLQGKNRTADKAQWCKWWCCGKLDGWLRVRYDSKSPC